jgi:hypothetical protein
MTACIREKASTLLIDWSIVTIIPDAATGPERR